MDAKFFKSSIQSTTVFSHCAIKHPVSVLANILWKPSTSDLVSHSASDPAFRPVSNSVHLWSNCVNLRSNPVNLHLTVFSASRNLNLPFNSNISGTCYRVSGCADYPQEYSERALRLVLRRVLASVGLITKR